MQYLDLKLAYTFDVFPYDSHLIVFFKKKFFKKNIIISKIFIFSYQSQFI